MKSVVISSKTILELEEVEEYWQDNKKCPSFVDTHGMMPQIYEYHDACAANKNLIQCDERF